MRRLVDCFAEYERLIISARTRAALAVRQTIAPRLRPGASMHAGRRPRLATILKTDHLRAGWIELMAEDNAEGEHL